MAPLTLPSLSCRQYENCLGTWLERVLSVSQNEGRISPIIWRENSTICAIDEILGVTVRSIFWYESCLDINSFHLDEDAGTFRAPYHTDV